MSRNIRNHEENSESAIQTRPAESDETDIAFSLLREAATWLKDRGIDYWQNWHRPPISHREWVLDGFQGREFHFVEVRGEIVGMFRLQDSDPLFWGLRDDRALYIHSFTTRRDLTGQGLGHKILEGIQQSAKDAGYELLRLDCGAGVLALRRFYQRFGFQEVGTTQVDGADLVLLEKRISLLDDSF